MTGKQFELTKKPTTFMSMGDVEQDTTLGKSTIKRLIEEGKFPKPVPIAHRRMAWLRVEVDKWCAERVRAHRGGDA